MAEHLGEIRIVGKTAFLGDLMDGIFLLKKQFLCILTPDRIDVFYRSHGSDILKFP